jgi:hypothetical protein
MSPGLFTAERIETPGPGGQPARRDCGFRKGCLESRTGPAAEAPAILAGADGPLGRRA